MDSDQLKWTLHCLRYFTDSDLVKRSRRSRSKLCIKQLGTITRRLATPYIYQVFFILFGASVAAAYFCCCCSENDFLLLLCFCCQTQQRSGRCRGILSNYLDMHFVDELVRQLLLNECSFRCRSIDRSPGNSIVRIIDSYSQHLQTSEQRRLYYFSHQSSFASTLTCLTSLQRHSVVHCRTP